MNPELFTYRGPIWIIPEIEWILPGTIALIMTVLCIKVFRRYQQFLDRKKFIALYRQKMADIDIHDTHALRKISILLRELFDLHRGRELFFLTGSWRKRVRTSHQPFLSTILGRLEGGMYGDPLSREEKMRLQKEILEYFDHLH